MGENLNGPAWEAADDAFNKRIANKNSLGVALQDALVAYLAALPAVDGEFARGVEAAISEVRTICGSSALGLSLVSRLRALSPASVGMEKDNEDRSFAASIGAIDGVIVSWDITDEVPAGFVQYTVQTRRDDSRGLPCGAEVSLSLLSKLAEGERSSSQSSEKET